MAATAAASDCCSRSLQAGRRTAGPAAAAVGAAAAAAALPSRPRQPISGHVAVAAASTAGRQPSRLSLTTRALPQAYPTSSVRCGRRVCCHAADPEAATSRAADEEYMEEYRQLKESIMRNTRTAGATLGVYLLVTVSGSAALCGILGMAFGTLYLSWMYRDVDSVKGTDRTPMLDAKEIQSPVQKYLAMWLCSYYYSIRPRLLVPVGLGALMYAYNHLADEPLSGLEQLSLALGFLSYKAALLTKVIDDIAPKPMSEQRWKPSIPKVEEDDALALDRWGRPVKPQYTMPTQALPEDVDPKDPGLLTRLIMEGVESLDDDVDESQTPKTKPQKPTPTRGRD